jgi:hypothetical protein
MLGDLLNNEGDPSIRRYRARFCIEFPSYIQL